MQSFSEWYRDERENLERHYLLYRGWLPGTYKDFCQKAYGNYKAKAELNGGR